LLGLSTLILIVSGVPIIASIIAIIGMLVMVPIAARMTGETNIDPLEQFGIFIALFVALIYGLLGFGIPVSALFLIVFFIAVACAVAGDVGHDFKAAKIIGTDPKDIVKIDIIAIIAVAIALPFILGHIISLFGSELFTISMPAPQAQVVAAAIGGLVNPVAFGIGVILALVYEISIKNKPVMMMPFGIGMFLGLSLSIPLVIGGLTAFWIQRRKKGWYHLGIIICTGIMAGEGLSGYSMAFMKSIGIDIYIPIIAVLIILSVLLLLKKR
jgi:uncharacterized oligopeptide transporter (OPT) family protein